MGVIRSNYLNLHEIMCSCAAKNFHKAKQLVQTVVFNASYLCFVQKWRYRILISKF
jgi:hypothetical protein